MNQNNGRSGAMILIVELDGCGVLFADSDRGHPVGSFTLTLPPRGPFRECRRNDRGGCRLRPAIRRDHVAAEAGHLLALRTELQQQQVDAGGLELPDASEDLVGGTDYPERRPRFETEYSSSVTRDSSCEPASKSW